MKKELGLVVDGSVDGFVDGPDSLLEVKFIITSLETQSANEDPLNWLEAHLGLAPARIFARLLKTREGAAIEGGCDVGVACAVIPHVNTTNTCACILYLV